MKTLILEDENAAARRLSKMLLELAPEAEILAIIDSIEEAVGWYQQHPEPDLVLQDIHLADGSSFEIFKEVAVKAPVIFVTAYDEYALQAFQVNSVDYLLKPIRKEELAKALEKYRERQKSPSIDYQKLIADLKPRTFQKRLLIRYGQHLKAIEVDEIAYFFSESKVTIAVTREGKQYPVDESLEQLEGIVDPGRFFRINRQFLVSFEAIKEMFTWSKSRVKLNLQPPSDRDTIVSVERSPHFKEWLIGRETDS